MAEPPGVFVGARARTNQGQLRSPRAKSVLMPCYRCEKEVWVDVALPVQHPGWSALCDACAYPGGVPAMRRALGIEST